MGAEQQFEPKIIAYLCTWCSYTGADTAGIARLKSPANLRTVRVPCSGRVSPEIIMRTFDQGADGVLVLACHIDECHYETGNHRTAKRFPVVQALMSFAGLEPERLRLDYVSASEGERYARITNEFVNTVRELGPVNWRLSESRRVVLQPQVVYTQGQRMIEADETLADKKVPVHSSLERQEAEIRKKAEELLTNGSVNTFIGYEAGSLGKVRPVFISHADQVKVLVWNRKCLHNLVVYLPEMIGTNQGNHKGGAEKGGENQCKIAVVVKPCDSRAVNVLLAENQIDRERVYLLGMACDGMLKADGTLQDRCLVCVEHLPALSDEWIGDRIEDMAPTKIGLAGDDPLMKCIQDLEALTPQQRMEFWLSQFDRCIRCYACRQACPMCNCPVCLYERDDSLWVGAAVGTNGIGLTEKRAFHLGRAYHLAGRCVGCDACERACPVGIPISLLNQKIADEIEQLFGHRAGHEQVLSPVVTPLPGKDGGIVQGESNQTGRMAIPVQEG